MAAHGAMGGCDKNPEATTTPGTPRSDADTWHIPARTPTRGTWRRCDGTNYNQARWRASYCNWRAPHGWVPFVGRPHCAACAVTIHEPARAISIDALSAVRIPRPPTDLAIRRRRQRFGANDATPGWTRLVVVLLYAQLLRPRRGMAWPWRATRALRSRWLRLSRATESTDATHLRRRT